jgi:formate/nitrite transporter FocA (FNT family)
MPDESSAGGERAPEEKRQEEEQEIEERTAPHARVVYEAIRSEGRDELERPASALFWSALAAGLSMGFSFGGEALIQHAIPDTAWRPLVSKLGYTVGFVIVILGRQQLFTENTLTAVLPLLKERTGGMLVKVLRLWGVVLLANLLGAFAFAMMAASTRTFEPEVATAFTEIARSAVDKAFGTIFVRAIFAGWLIALMVWLLPYAETARFWVVVLLTYVVGLGEFDHIIIGSVEGFYAALRGMVSWSRLLGGYMLPTLLGNILGGVVLVALLGHAQVESGQEEGAEKGRERRVRRGAAG